MRDCLEGRGEVPSKQPVLQYRAWLRSEMPRRGGGDVVKFGIEDGWYGKGGPMRDAVGDPRKSIHALGSSLEHKKGTEFLLPFLEPSDRGEEHTEGGQESRNQRKDHEKGKETSLGEHSEGLIANLEEENRERLGA